MDIDSLQKIVLAIAESESVDAVLQTIVCGLAGQPDVALNRIWLIEPGDICQSCVMRSACADQTRCLHLAASAGNPLMDRGCKDNAREDWTRINGHFRRIPLNTPSTLEHIPTTGLPIHIRVADERSEQLRFFRPDWLEAQKIRSLVGQPLVFKNAVLGALSVFSRTELSEHEVRWLRAIADHAAVAIGTLQTAGQAAAPHASLAAMAERWRSVFEKSAIGVALTDENGRFLHVNHAYEEVLGYTQEELRKLSFYDITPEEFRESNRALAAELWAGKCARYQFEKPYRRKDGSLIWVRLHASIVPGTKSVPRFGLALCENITERKRAEESLRKSEERWRTLLEINNAIITNLSQDALLRSIADTLLRVAPFDRAALTLYQPDKDVFRFVAIEGVPASGYFQPGVEIGPQDSSVAWVFRHQKPILRSDLEKEQEYLNERRLAAEGMRSHCVVPLIARGKSIGTLNVAHGTQGQYTAEVAEFLQEVANQVGLAIENMKAYEEIAALNAKVAQTADHLRTLLEINNALVTNLSEDTLLYAISDAIRRVVPFDRAALTLYLPETGVFRYLGMESRLSSDYFRSGTEFAPKSSVSEWVFDHQQAVVRGDLEKQQQYANDRRLVAEGLRSDCVVPLILRGSSLGTLNVGSVAKNQYSPADAEFLQEVANQVALAVENMRSYEEIAVLK
ncbi:MAG TPA: GAF domain-containing protein, partial [Acidobacteriota bacterium]|nr:GAF domain-containing protein [Acidobacteriota bacterium]